MKINLSTPYFFGNEIKNLDKSVKKKWISSSGSASQDFENKVKKYIKANYALGIINCTSALQLSVNIFDRSVNYKSAETYFTEPLAWALVWGLSFAAIATLFVTPALLALPDRLKELRFSRKKSPILSN